jgi:hypothetical protein
MQPPRCPARAVPTFHEEGLRESLCFTSRWEALTCILAGRLARGAVEGGAALLSAARLLDEPAGGRACVRGQLGVAWELRGAGGLVG